MGNSEISSSRSVVKAAVFSFQGLAFSLLCLSVATPRAFAQVALTAEGTVMYDDNIYLENDREVPPILVQDQNQDPGLPTSLKPKVDVDGKPNDDMIYITSLGLATNVPIAEYLTSSFEGTFGYMWFSEQQDSSRFLVESLLSVASEESFIPKPFGFVFNSELSSSTYDLYVPGGSTARSTVTHDARLNLPFNSWEIGSGTTVGPSYTLTRHDFLGELMPGDSSDLAVERDGADWFSNLLSLSLQHALSDTWTSNLSFYGDLKTFTSSSTNELGEPNTGDLDRIDYGPRLTTTYQALETLQLNGGIGVEFSHYLDTVERITFIEVPGSTPQQMVEESDSDETSLSYLVGANYAPFEGTSLAVVADQRLATNIDGQRTTSRSAGLNLMQALGERFSIVCGGKYSQNSSDGSLSDATDLIEGTAGLSITVMSNVAMTLGYNYAKQDADSIDLSNPFDSDYESNKVFLSLSGGLVGVNN